MLDSLRNLIFTAVIYRRTGAAGANADAVFGQWSAGRAMCTTGGVVVDVTEETTKTGDAHASDVPLSYGKTVCQSDDKWTVFTCSHMRSLGLGFVFL